MANTGNTQQQINYGATPNDGLGDPLRTAFIKTDENFDNIWLAGPVGSNITIGNNTIQTNNVNGNLILQPNGVGIIQANANFVPSANNIRDLGSTSSKWRRAYINNLNIQNLEVPGDAVINGNLTVEGDTIQIGNIVTDTLTIQLANTAANGAQANGAGITVGANDDIATLLYDNSTGKWTTNIGVSMPDITVSSIQSDDSSFVNIQDGLFVDGPIDATGTISAPYFVGNGSLLTGITTYGNSDVAAYLPTYDGALAGQTLTITSSGGNVWSINDRTLTAPNGGTWFSNPDGVDGYLTSPVNGYLTLQSLYAGPGFNIASQIQLEHDFVRVKVFNGPDKEWDFEDDGTLTAPGDIELDGNLVAANTVVGENLEITKAGNIWYWNGALMLSPAGGSWFSNPDVQEEFISSGVDGYLSLQSLGPGPGFDIASEVKLEHGMIRIGVYNGSNKEWDFNEDGTLDVPGDILPQANATQSLGNVDLQWANLWVANNTIYLGGVPVGIGAGNVLTVGGEPVLTNDSNTTITTTGNITANYFIGDGSLLTGISSTGNITFTDTTMSPPDGVDITISAANSEVIIEAFDIRLDATDDLRLTGNDIVSLRNRSTTDPVTIITDFDNSETTWTFAVDGTLTTPGDITVAGDVTGTVGASTLVLRAQPASNTSIQLNNSVDSVIGTVANLEIRTDVSNTAKTWTFDTTGNLTATGNITTTGNISGAYILGNGSQLTGLPASYSNANVATFLADFGSNSISTTGNITAGNISGNISITGNVTGTSANVTLIAGSNQWTFNNAGNLVLPGNTFAVNYANGTAVQLGGAGTYGNANVADFLDSLGSNAIVTTGNITGGNLLSTTGVYANVNLVVGDVANTSATKTRFVTEAGFSYIQTGNGTSGTTGNIVFSPYADPTQRVVIDTSTGNVTAANFVGNVSLTGNIQGTSANVELVAGSYTWTFDNTGVVTLPAVGGNEGGEINFAIPTANTTLVDRVKLDVYQDRIRFFDGSTKGAYIDLSQAATGVGSLLNNRVSGFVDAGTFVTMDNIKATVTTSGNRGLSLASVSGTFNCNIGANFNSVGAGNGGSAGVFTITTTASSSIFGWGFNNQSDTATYIITDITNSRSYRITLQIGGSFLNNMITIERLV